MPSPTAIARKTALGREEQRTRAGGLGQRHRTILFLVDGQRSAAEVLNLAAQAGASAQHFDDLVRLGYVEIEGIAAPMRAAAPMAPGTLPVPPSAGAPAPLPASASGPADLAEPGDAPPSAPEAPPVLDQVARPRVSGAPLLPVRRPAGASRPAPLAPVGNSDPAVLDEARAHLLEALRIDPPPFVSRLASRVRGAEGAPALIELVLQIEREIARQRRSPVGMHHVEQARELLGLGNTVVTDESGWHGWPDTL